MSESVISIKKEAIYAAAARLFQEKGYSATSMRELAAAVGLEASSLYSHISSKADLLDHICFHAAHRFTEGMQVITATRVRPIEQIRTLLDLHMTIALEDPTSQTVFNDEWRHLPEERLIAFRSLRKQYEQDFLSLIERAQQAGEIRAMEPRLVLLTLLSALRWLYVGKGLNKRMKPTDIKSQMATFLMHGLTPE
ncbi:MAG: TetR/AcrR family transcriptional regulator [Lewinellaceae bacterium]|nr:TetR/AcrR family transcriptional regulator [Lewinellaceae bacterium]HRW75292.1 TetR/AcrR family transcriptional regulator [Saprospiraceae bacterium]